MKIKTVMVKMEDGDVMEMLWDEFIYNASKHLFDSGYWSEEKCKELKKKYG